MSITNDITTNLLKVFEDPKRSAVISGVLLGGAVTSCVAALYFRTKNKRIESEFLDLVNEIEIELAYADGYNDCLETLKNLPKNRNKDCYYKRYSNE